MSFDEDNGDNAEEDDDITYYNWKKKNDFF